jgi:hypothetical protein
MGLVRAFLDEAVPVVRGHLAYVVAAVVGIQDDPDATKATLEAVVAKPGMRAPFHWHKEGRDARRRMVRCIIDLGVAAHVVVHHPTGRRHQEAARRVALQEMLPFLVHEGVADLTVESRGPEQDRYDRAVLLDGLRALENPAMTYRWEGKSNPLLWLPDAVCGAVSMFLGDNGDPTWYDELRERGVITEPVYIAGH